MLWQSLVLSLVLQVALIALAWWGLVSFRHLQVAVDQRAIRWLGAGAWSSWALLFPASFGIVVSIFMEKIADIVESRYYPRSGRRAASV